MPGHAGQPDGHGEPGVWTRSFTALLLGQSASSIGDAFVHRDALTGLFVQVLAVCARKGLVSVDLVAGDGTKVKASASKPAFRSWSAERAHDEGRSELEGALCAGLTSRKP